MPTCFASGRRLKPRPESRQAERPRPLHFGVAIPPRAFGACIALGVIACGGSDDPQQDLAGGYPPDAAAGSGTLPAEGSSNGNEASRSDSPEGAGGHAGGDGVEPSAGGAGCTADPNAAPPLAEACSHDLTCQAATQVGDVTGDLKTPPVTQRDSTSAWLRLTAREAVHHPGGAPMRLLVTLESPEGEDFDLYVHLFQESAGADACDALPLGSDKGPGQVDEIAVTWGESGPFANVSSDARPVLIEVRAVEAQCNGTKEWQLTVQGGT